MTESTIQAEFVQAQELFRAGKWGEAEESFVATIDKIAAADDKNADEQVKVLLEYTELLIQKERKDDCKRFCDDAITIILKQLPDDKQLLLEAYLTYVDVLSLRDEFGAAELIIVKARDIVDSDGYDDKEKRAQVLSTQAALKIALENFEEAEELLTESLSICDDNKITKGTEAASVFSILAMLRHLKGDFSLAQKYFLLSFDALQEQDHSRSFQDICFGYTTLLVSQSRYPEAINFLDDKIKWKESVIGLEHPLLKRAVGALAIANAAYGQLEEAEVQAQRYNRIVEMMGNAGKELKIDCLRTLVDILVEQSRYSEAEVLLTRASDLVQNIEDDNIRASIISDLARLKIELGEYDEAERLCKRALELTRATKGDDHLETAMCLSILGSAYFSNRKIDKAESAYRKAIKLIEKHTHFFTTFIGAENYRNLAIILTQRGNYDEAEGLFLKILAMHSRNDGPTTIQVAETHKNLGELYEIQEKNQDALMQYERAFSIASQIFSADNAELADFALYIADIHKKESNFAKAKKIYKEALVTLENALGPSHPKTCTLLQRFGELAIEEQEYASAQEFFNRALNNLEQILGTEHPDIGYVCYCLGAACHWQEKLEEAEKHYRRALSVKEKHLGRTHRDLAIIIEPLIDILSQQGKEAEVASFHRRMIEIDGYDAQKKSK